MTETAATLVPRRRTWNQNKASGNATDSEQEKQTRSTAYTTQSYVNQRSSSQFGLRNLDDSEGV